MMSELGTEPHSLPTFFTVVTFQAYTLFLVYSHVGVPILLVFIFVRTGVTFIPSIIMAVEMSVKISPVLETTITAFLFAHETGVSLMGYPVLFEPTFKWETLATVLTDKTKIFVCVHMFVQGSLNCKLFITHLAVFFYDLELPKIRFRLYWLWVMGVPMKSTKFHVSNVQQPDSTFLPQVNDTQWLIGLNGRPVLVLGNN